MMMGQPAAQIPNSNYNPDYFEYDDELPEGQMGERVILSNDPVPREVGVIRTIGTKKQGVSMDFCDEDFYEWNSEDEEDDARIDAFLQSHKPKPTSSKRVCTFYQTDSCRNGAKCAFAHEYSDQSSYQASVGRFNTEDDAECQICLEKVLTAGRQFGVLDRCDHIFCLKCIRSWRATYDKRTTKHHYRTCPICRQTSYLVIPSYFHCLGNEKEALIEDYKGTLGEIPCRLFNRGKGECPFRDSCMYSHVTKEGE
mmetsp:Transcript_1308/g.1774  ORF Transcript_1308/g.1774 Transcript_1308/m.1774 type:complete len:254 (-) Transcript_1308:180-941(-)